MPVLQPAKGREPRSDPPDEAATPRREWLQAAALALLLVWLNGYICRELFWAPNAYMNSMHGFWIALARRAGDSWFHPSWWPYWDGGIPFEFTYAPLIPALTAVWAALGHVPPPIALQSLTAVVYCLLPLSLFIMAWRLTRAPLASFLAALVYSLTSVATLLFPDDHFAWQHFWDAHRLYLLVVWDDLPHAAALALLPLSVLALVHSLRRRRLRDHVLTIFLIALMASASFFGVTMILMAAVCLLFVYRREELRRNVAIVLGAGAVAYAIVSPFLPPSLWNAIAAASGGPRGDGFSVRSLTALAIVALGWAVLWRYLPRWTRDWKLQFFALFAYLTGAIPAMAAWLHRGFLPQPGRYMFEMELTWPLLAVFALRPWIRRVPRSIQVTLLGLILALAAEQIVSHRRFARDILQPRDATQTIEGRTAFWVEQNLPGVRVMLPGSIGQWADDFAGIVQFSGSSWSQAANQVQQLGEAAIYNGGDTPERDARVGLAWLKAYGTGAVAINGPHSQEFWKPYAHPTKFEGRLPVLWREDDVAVYSVPQRTASLAHVVPPAALVTRSPRSAGEIAALETYGSALDDSSLPLADFRWEDRNHIRIHANMLPGQALSVQVSYHPGWHAHVQGRSVPVRRDGLGLMWMDPGCSGPCEVQLDYDGGWELRLCRYLSVAALLGLLAAPLAARWRAIRPVKR